MVVILTFILVAIFQFTFSTVNVYNGTNELIKKFNDQEASFGGSFPKNGLKGFVTTTNPANGCSKISPPPTIPMLNPQWIALIPRTQGNDSCEFGLKVFNAQKANFSSVIIYNYKDELITMGPSDKKVDIPSTFITHTDGLTIISKYLYNKTTLNSTPMYFIKIFPEDTFKIGAYIIPFVVIISFVFFSLIGFVLVRCYLNRRRTRRHRLPRSALKHLQIKKFVKGDPWEVCAICLDDYEEGAKLRILPCSHAYHMKCIDPWLLNNRRQCPVCKRYVFPNPENSDDEENVNQQSSRRATEDTPLLNSNSDNFSTSQRSSERYSLNPSGAAASNQTFSQDSEFNDDVGSCSSRSTTTELIFEQQSPNSRCYGSVTDPSGTTSAARFFVGSIGGTTDNTNASGPSLVEDVNDIDIIDDEDDERMHSTTTTSEDNPAYVNDEESTTDKNRTHL